MYCLLQLFNDLVKKTQQQTTKSKNKKKQNNDRVNLWNFIQLNFFTLNIFGRIQVILLHDLWFWLIMINLQLFPDYSKKKDSYQNILDLGLYDGRHDGRILVGQEVQFN